MIIARNKGFLVRGSLGTILATRAGAPIYSLHGIWRVTFWRGSVGSFWVTLSFCHAVSNADEARTVDSASHAPAPRLYI